jgi:hypothetical protein
MNGDMLGWLKKFVELFVGGLNYRGGFLKVKNFQRAMDKS